jgi:hypothetical protein
MHLHNRLTNWTMLYITSACWQLYRYNRKSINDNRSGKSQKNFNIGLRFNVMG